MRILTVTNLYPPHAIGGYEVGCLEVVELLKRRGHDVLVLTSTYGVHTPSKELGVWRALELERSELAYRPAVYQREFVNRRYFRAALKAFSPELVYFWNQTWLTGSLVQLTRDAQLPYAFYISDENLRGWRTDSLWRWWWHPIPANPIKAGIKAIGRRSLRIFSLIDDGAQVAYRSHRQFTSRYIQRLFAAPNIIGSDEVIPWGIDLEKFPYSSSVASSTRLLYVGQIVEHKGVWTAVRAVEILRDRFGLADVALTIVGGSTDPSFDDSLRRYVAEKGLVKLVMFAGKVDRAALAAVYRKHAILVFPSEWEEPFGITPLEAMASGTVVVGTNTGGSKEVFVHGENAMIFQPRDAGGCAEAVYSLANDPKKYRQLRVCARRLVEERYSLSGMVDRIEQHLLGTRGATRVTK